MLPTYHLAIPVDQQYFLIYKHQLVLMIFLNCSAQKKCMQKQIQKLGGEKISCSIGFVLSVKINVL